VIWHATRRRQRRTRHVPNRKSVHNSHRKAFHLERLEARTLLAADLGWHAHDQESHADDDEELIIDFDLPGVNVAFTDGDPGGGEVVSAALNPLSSIPILHSNPAATAKIYLDFDGHYESSWGSYGSVTSPVFDQDSNTSSFSDSELATIQAVWERVAEDFAPFNLDVTTEDPGSFPPSGAIRVSIGGNGSWIGSPGGVAYVNSFNSSYTSTAYVFSKNLGNGNAKYVAEAVSHEAGHTFGLRHQSRYDSGGNLVETYHTGSGGWAPIMGVGYYQTQSVWHNGTTTSASTYQDDLAIITNSTNGFGYRGDDHGDTSGAATALVVTSGTQVSASGIVERMSDVDYFSFTTGAGQVSLAVNGASLGANLDVRLELRTAGGSLVASADPGSSLSATITTTVAAGDYRLVVANHGDYGDLGQYSVSGTIQDSGPPPPSLNVAIAAASISESAGANATTVTVTRVNAASLASPLTVTLSSNDTSEATVPATVTIAAGQTSATAWIAAVDDGVYDGTRTVTITATASGFTSANDTVNVLDNESPPLGPNGKYVKGLYNKILNRSVDSAGLNFWTQALDSGGASRLDLVNLLWNSPENRGNQVVEHYTRYLGRSPSTAERDYWVTSLLGGWSHPDDMARGFVGSAEYSWVHSSNDDFVDAVYQHALERAADPGGHSIWVDALQNGMPRIQMIDHFLHTTERYVNVTDDYYQNVMGRAASNTELTYWANVVHGGGKLDDIGKYFLSSPEFYDWSNANFAPTPDFVAPMSMTDATSAADVGVTPPIVGPLAIATTLHADRSETARGDEDADRADDPFEIDAPQSPHAVTADVSGALGIADEALDDAIEELATSRMRARHASSVGSDDSDDSAIDRFFGREPFDGLLEPFAFNWHGV